MERRKRKQLRLSNTAGSPLTENQIVDATIAFANGATLLIDGLVPKDSTSKFVGDDYIEYTLRLSRAVRERGISGFKELNENDNIPTDAEDHRKRRRTNTRVRLGWIVNDPKRASEELRGWDVETGIRQKQVLRHTEHGVHLTSHYDFTFEGDLVDLGVILLTDTERGYAGRLCQCQSSSCGDFFFKVQPARGAPRSKYCSDEHMALGHDERAQVRMRNNRATRRRK